MSKQQENNVEKMTDDVRNLDIFDESAGQFFALLYAAFPVRIHISTIHPDLEELLKEEFFYPIVSDYPDTASHDQAVKAILQQMQDSGVQRAALERLTVIRSETAHWLVGSGYLDIEDEETISQNTSTMWRNEYGADLGVSRPYSSYVRYLSFKGARLTPKGLEALRAVPDFTDSGPRMSFGEQLSNYANDVGTEAKKQGVSRIVGEVIGYAMRAMSSQ